MSKLYESAKPLAAKVMNYSRDTILVNMRFLDVVLSALTPEPREGLAGFACDGVKIYYDPVYLLKKYKEEPAYGVRTYLHMLFHLIFYHSFRYDRLDKEAWSLAADIAVEASILELEMPGMSLKRDEKLQGKLRGIREEIGALTAEKVYRYLKNFQISSREREELSHLFFVDSHIYWEPSEEITVTLEQWKKLSERVKADLKSFSAGKTRSESMDLSLAEAVKDRYRYDQLLKKFTVMNEDMQINDDEFDYIYYTYGLDKYGNMPLVEPLEYKDSRKVREFVIAIDTSASCRGPLVSAFLQKTYAMLCGEENFFRKMNVHIIQCDHEVQKDTKITCKEDLDYFLSREKLTGFGSTDFRPVFAYVDELMKKGEFENLKGLLYFTDGYGIYPQKMPPYDVMFVFLDNGDEGPQVPPWAIKVLLDYEELEEG
ncbi:MAG: VWA-like domain-containing protein [Firmicutes bacterium]|nr:VWA-like domain-containing protein [Bacillota bacterium]